MGERLKVYSDVLDYDEFFVEDSDLVYDPKAVNKRLRKDGVSGWLEEFRAELAAVEPFSAGELEELMKGWVERKELKLGQIIHPVRVAVTGKPAGIGMFETLELLGRESVLRRMDRALELCETSLDDPGAES
jgi:glutamyl-tRNA synthetase